MKRARRSTVWDHFSRKDDKVQCNYCDALFTYHSATSPLIYHLKNVHTNVNSGETSSTNEITKRIVNMIVKDMLPLSVADGEGFQELMGFIEPGYRIPSRKTFTNRLEQQYAEKKAELKEKLASADVALTTDCWTALTTESYITVTCHYIEEDWQVKSAVLLTESFSDKHTADNLAEKLKESVDDWGLAGRVAACVHDNARNIVAANDPTRVSWQSLPCFAHTLQLAINDGFALDMHRVIAAAGRLVKHFHHSTPATRALEAKQEQLQLPKHRLIQSCKTRWNSVRDMFERLMEQRWAVTAVLSDRTVTKIQNARILEMKDEHWQLMEDSLPVLKALKCATTVLSSETEVSISSTYPITFSLINAHLKSDDGGHPKIEAFKNEVRSQLAKRMKVDSDNFPMIAMILDPRHKHLGYLKPSQRLTLKNAVLDIAATTTVEQSDAADSAGSLEVLLQYWVLNISSLIKKAEQRMYFLRQLKKFNLLKAMMVHCYSAIISSILISSITIWYAATTARNKARLQRIIHSPEKVIGCNLPSLQDLYSSRTQRRAGKIAADPSHPGHKLFDPLPSGRRLRSIKTKTSRHKNSFFPSAAGLINKTRLPH
ncbi:E3 SUMO-protein ligase ZBED1-like [Odontesthes bonariensis]|uniref:E3 SUMO-protein ligase ZBED1-like n=1 Tax=Odontesthes bonariensis TaxID=219752 RepID=UPI003F5848CF